MRDQQFEYKQLSRFLLQPQKNLDSKDIDIYSSMFQLTKLGKMLDPTADKLTLMAVMICFGIKFPKIFPFMILLIVKEIIMLVAGAVLLKRKLTPPAARWYGKISTVIFYISVITIILLKAAWNIDCEILNIILMTVTAVCMLYALYKYFTIFKTMIKKENY